jgi:TPR repeat protein
MEILNKKNRLSHAGLLIIGSLLGVSATPSAALDLQTGMAAYHQGDYAQAFHVFFREAEEGNAMAQHLLGTLYQTGRGVERDPEAGFLWCLKAAQGGVREAQFQVGLMYLQGEGVTENEEKAIDWLWEAADRGYPQASEILQFIFSNDFGVGC